VVALVSAPIGWREKVSVGAGIGTDPGADQDTVICVAGSAPQVSRSCSGAVVTGSSTVVVGGPAGAELCKSTQSAPRSPVPVIF
jgi:hypothetical protein